MRTRVLRALAFAVKALRLAVELLDDESESSPLPALAEFRRKKYLCQLAMADELLWNALRERRVTMDNGRPN